MWRRLHEQVFCKFCCSFCNRYTAISVGLCNKRIHSLGSVFVRSCAQSRRWFTRAKCRLRERINRAFKKRLCRNNRNSYCIFSATVISSLFSTTNATTFLFRKKVRGEGQVPPGISRSAFPDF